MRNLSQAIVIALIAGAGLSRCAVVSVVDTAASVTGSVVSTTADVAGSVVSGAADAVGGSKSDKDKKDDASEKSGDADTSPK